MATVYDKSSLFLAPSGVSNGTVFVQKPVPIYGSELVTNGDFATDSDWNKGAGWSISGGTANCDGTQSVSTIIQNTTNSSGKYFIQFELKEYTQGIVGMSISGTGGQDITVSDGVLGVYNTIITTTSNNFLIEIKGNSNFIGSIDNVSVKEVLSPDGDFTFTRGSNLSATRVNEAQLIEKGRENLLVQSNQFDTTWAAGGTITIVGGQSDKDGGTDAWLLSKASAWSYLRQSITPSGVNTFSVYAKANASSYMLMRVSGVSNPIVYFNLSSGAVSLELNNIGATIESVGSGWYRCSIVTDISITDVRVYPTEVNTAGAATGSIYIQDAQLEQGLVATSVITTGAGTVQAGLLENTPRLDYSGGATCPSLLLEPSRTNALVNSEYFPSWNKNEVTLYGGYSAPDGTNSAYKITKNGTQSYLLIPGNSTSSDARSIYARTTSGTGQVNLTSHNSNTNSLFTITEEWQRFDVTSTLSISGNYYAVDFRAGDLDEIIIWGAQQEVGSYPTSYIPTYGTSQTRSQDVCTGAVDAATFNDSEGVLYAEIAALADDGTFRNISVNNGTTAQSVRIYYRNTTNQITALIGSGSGGSVTASIVNAYAFNKIAFVYQNDNAKLFVNGILEGTIQGITMPTGLNQLDFSIANVLPFYGKAKEVIYFPTALSDLQLAILTGATTYETFDEMALALNYTVYE